MNFVKNLASHHQESSNDANATHSNHEAGSKDTSQPGFLKSLVNKAEGKHHDQRRQEMEKNEDLLDKGVDLFQEKILHQGKQDNESITEQMKDEAISDSIRKGFKNITGKDIPIKDKSTSSNYKIW